jgi:tight adherence protein C
MTRLVLDLLQGNALYGALFLLTAVMVGALLFGGRALISLRSDPVGRRIRASVTAERDLVPVVPAFTPKSAQSSLLDGALRPLAAVTRPTDEGELEGLRSRLSHAGYRSERAMYAFLAAKLVMCVGGAVAVLWYSSQQAQPLDEVALYTIVAMIIGLFAPNVWLAGRTSERKGQLSRSLPDALDLLVTCVEAGLGLDAALNRVAGEVTLSAPLLSQELMQTALEMRAGLARGESVRRLADRNGLDELKYLASIIVQTEIFGTSVAKSLRVMSDGMRLRRSQRAEENAAKVAVKMTLPLVLCILPSLFLVLLGPAIINIIEVLMPTLAGQRTQ